MPTSLATTNTVKHKQDFEGGLKRVTQFQSDLYQFKLIYTIVANASDVQGREKRTWPKQSGGQFKNHDHHHTVKPITNNIKTIQCHNSV